MEGVLQSYGRDDKDFIISILIASTSSPFRDKLYHALTHKKWERDWKYQLKVHTCERIRDVVKAAPTIQVDYVVFLLNTKEGVWLQEKLDDDISHLDSVIKFGRFCIVNDSMSVGMELPVTYKYLLSVRKKYATHIMVGNIMDEEKCSYLAERILILVNAACGLRSGVPYLDYPMDGALLTNVDVGRPTDINKSNSESSNET